MQSPNHLGDMPRDKSESAFSRLRYSPPAIEIYQIVTNASNFGAAACNFRLFTFVKLQASGDIHTSNRESGPFSRFASQFQTNYVSSAVMPRPARGSIQIPSSAELRSDAFDFLFRKQAATADSLRSTEIVRSIPIRSKVITFSSCIRASRTR